MPAIDFSTVQGVEPVPAGKYLATITKAEAGVSKNGNEKIDLQWKITGGDYNNRIIFDVLTFTAAAMFRVKNTMLALGAKKKFAGNVEPAWFVGKTANIVVDIQASTQVDPESGEAYPPRNRVKKIELVAA